MKDSLDKGSFQVLELEATVISDKNLSECPSLLQRWAFIRNVNGTDPLDSENEGDNSQGGNHEIICTVEQRRVTGAEGRT